MRIKQTVFSAVYHPPHGGSVFADEGQVAALQVDPAHRPVHSCAESLVVVGAKADIHDGSTVLKGLQKRAMTFCTIAMCIV